MSVQEVAGCRQFSKRSEVFFILSRYEDTFGGSEERRKKGTGTSIRCVRER